MVKSCNDVVKRCRRAVAPTPLGYLEALDAGQAIFSIYSVIRLLAPINKDLGPCVSASTAQSPDSKLFTRLALTDSQLTPSCSLPSKTEGG